MMSTNAGAQNANNCGQGRMNSANPGNSTQNTNINTTGNNNNNQNIFFLLSPLINNSQITTNNVCVPPTSNNNLDLKQQHQ